MAKSSDKSADKSHLPWSIKGISPEARDIARAAAAEQGITMGEWLTGVIERMGADDDPGGGPSDIDTTEPPAQSTEDQIAALNIDMDLLRDRIAERLTATEDKIQNIVAPLSEIVSQMAERLDRLEDHQDGALLDRPVGEIDYRGDDPTNLDRAD